MASPARWITGWIAGRTRALRFPSLFLLTGALFLVDVLVPDLLPFMDEILLGLATLLLGRWRARKETPRKS